MKNLYNNQIIKETAEQKGLNPTQIAAKADRSVQTVYQVFSGEDVRYSTLLNVVNAVGLPMGTVCKIGTDSKAQTEEKDTAECQFI